MGDIELACHTSSWGPDSLVGAISEIARCGYTGIESTPEIVQAFEDRPIVLEEILEENGLRLVAILSPSRPISTLSLEEEIERPRFDADLPVRGVVEAVPRHRVVFCDVVSLNPVAGAGVEGGVEIGLGDLQALIDLVRGVIETARASRNT